MDTYAERTEGLLRAYKQSDVTEHLNTEFRKVLRTAGEKPSAFVNRVLASATHCNKLARC